MNQLNIVFVHLTRVGRFADGRLSFGVWTKKEWLNVECEWRSIFWWKSEVLAKWVITFWEFLGVSGLFLNVLEYFPYIQEETNFETEIKQELIVLSSLPTYLYLCVGWRVFFFRKIVCCCIQNWNVSIPLKQLLYWNLKECC